MESYTPSNPGSPGQSPSFQAYPAGSPRWWLYRLIWALIGQQKRYDELEDYHLGNHPLPVVDPKHKRMLAQFQRMSQTNYITLFNNAPVGRMTVNDFRFGPTPEPDPDARRIWSINDMDLQSTKVHTAASIFGDSYVLVGPTDPVTGAPTMTVQDPRCAIVQPHPLYPTRSLAGLMLWDDIYLGRAVAVLYLPDQIYTYVGPPIYQPYQAVTVSARILGQAGSYGAFELLSQEENVLGEVPLVHFEWQPDHNGMSLGECELVLHIQDRINQMIMDRLVTAKEQAFVQRFATGIKVIEDKKAGKSKGPQVSSPYEAGAANLWVTDEEKAQFGQLPAVDFKQMLEAVRDDISDIAAITQTPAHYLMNRMVNVSGDTLTQAEAGFVAKVRLRMKTMGWGWERVMRLAFQYEKDSRAKSTEASVLWASPVIHKDVDSGDAASKWAASGLELGLNMEQHGEWTPEQIKLAREYRDAEQQRQQDIAQKQAEMKMSQPQPRNNSGANSNPRTS